jgi:mannose-6-phosphate isomerase
VITRVDNTPRDYAWGSSSAIAELRGLEPSGAPEAELWLGTHPGSPTRIVDAPAGTPQTIAELLAHRGEEPLPYLLKVLAAAHPLSVQAHPSPEQARAGFARENAAGIPVDAPHRNYRDDKHKPELIVALSDEFEALCGFRAIADTVTELDSLAEALEVDLAAPALRGFIDELGTRGDGAVRWAVEWALTPGNAADLVAEIAAAAALVGDDLLMELSRDYPGDPGVVVALLLNRVTLVRGEALYLPAGNMHAYIRGLGIEVMAASDNVLRGGLTSKHVDVPELLSVVTDAIVPVPRLIPSEPAPGVRLFTPDVPDFAVADVRVGGEVAQAVVPLARHAIAICVAGDVRVSGAHSELPLPQGDIAFISQDEGHAQVTGSGQVFIAL